MKGIHPGNRHGATLALVFGIAVCACRPSPPPPPPPPPPPSQAFTGASAVLTKIGKPAEDSLYACMANAYAQGLPAAQIIEECSTKLLDDDRKGFGGPLGEITTAQQDMFDPAAISGACNGGDPERGDSGGRTQPRGTGSVMGYGHYSYGSGMPTRDERGNGAGSGMTQYESNKIKLERAKAADAALKEFTAALNKEIAARAALNEAKKTGDAAKIDAAQKALDAAKAENAKKTEAAKKAVDLAKQDPNNGGVVRGTGEPSACDLALDAARELLRECHRTGWKDFRCQRLQARMNDCPDPALILVDPEQGYTCGEKPDAEAVKNAWVARCQERVRYGPDGNNPCAPPVISGSGRFISGKCGDVCNDPHAFVDQEGEACAATVTIGRTFGQPDYQAIILLGMDKIGGPMIVIPPRPTPSPRPGPDPRPPR